MLWSEPKSEDSLARTIQPLMHLPATPILRLALLWLLAMGVVCAQQSPPTEQQLKTAYLLNFAKFVEWPEASFAESSSPIVLGVLGENPFGDDLEQMVRGKTINNRPIVVKPCRSLAETTNCHILFISASEKARLPEILAGLSGASVLTVSEMERFTEKEGMINFIRQGTKIRFQINEGAAKKVHLTISSKLLSLASR